MRNNLTRKQVLIAPTLELIIRFDNLMHIAETAPAHVLKLADAKETVWIEDEMRRRLIKLVGHDFYPPVHSTIACVKPMPVPKVVQPVVQSEGKLNFKIIITSSIGTKVATYNVKVDSKPDADMEAEKMIAKLGLEKATYKIS